MAFESCINIPVLIQLLEYVCDAFMLAYIRNFRLPFNFFCTILIEEINLN